MPSQTKSKVIKNLNKNHSPECRYKLRNKVSKPARKELAHKTSSISDINTKITKENKIVTKVAIAEKTERPRRERRLPSRYVENNVLDKLPNGVNSVIPTVDCQKNRQSNIAIEKEIQSKPESKIAHLRTGNLRSNGKQQTKISQVSDTSGKNLILKCDNVNQFKSPNRSDSPLTNRPKRIHRLPSRFEDNSISPSKFLPILPTYASTPIQQKSLNKKRIQSNAHTEKSNSVNKFSPDTNNNPKKIRAAKKIVDFKNKKSLLHIAQKSKTPVIDKVDKTESLKVVGENINKKGQNQDNIDVYEFTYDPNEEPPQKKKRKKRVVKKNPAKPKFVMFKNNYEQNLSKTLTSLKKIVSKNLTSKRNQQIDLPVKAQNSEAKQKPIQSNTNFISKTVQCLSKPTVVQNVKQTKALALINTNNKPISNAISIQEAAKMTTNYKPKDSLGNTKSANVNKCASIRIEEIAADFEWTNNNDDFNYSPVNSPIRTATSSNELVEDNVRLHLEQRNSTNKSAINTRDPLNLDEKLSFFAEHPIASSSMNMSLKHPLASPWRVEYENLPIKWHANTYVKPNMTPAVESSFINTKDDDKKKHVYTNMLLQSNEMLPEIIDDNTSHLKQTSIIYFMKEVAEKHACKKRKGLFVTPTKDNSLFHDISNSSLLLINKSPDKMVRKEFSTQIHSKNFCKDKENIRENRKRKNKDNIEAITAKSPCKQKDKNVTYFGFDDSENQGNENVSPQKNMKIRSLRPKARAVLQEINGQVGPTRAALPLAVKSKTITSSEAVNKMYEDMKSGAVAPTFDQGDIENSPQNLTLNLTSEENNDNTDSNSVHLFEDIEMIHHLKPTRKSYGKSKKVTFPDNSVSDDDTTDRAGACPSDLSDVDDFGDLTFTMPVVSKKKPTRKKKAKSQLSNKEKKEADAWAAGFNSMCEDIEEFRLVVE